MNQVADLFYALFSHPIWKFLTFISCFIIVVMTVLMIAMGCFRLKGLDPRTAINRLPQYPMISVIMCCKGTHSNSLSNFKRNLRMEYPGPAEFIFVVESIDDPAASCAQKAIDETVFPQQLRRTQIAVAGLSFHNAQKIHNMLIGVTYCSPESKYVLFADDDVFFYPGLMEELVYPLIKEPEKVLVSTGYEFIAPPSGSCIANYCLLTYRIHNLFSYITERPILCWGGCWMSPLWVFRENFAHVVDCYLDGGYSDDTIISCLAQQKGYVCAHPHRAIFPNNVDKNTPFAKYWDFLKRQFFVTDTYSTNYNKRVVHSLAYLICSTIWLLVIWISISPFMGILAIISCISNLSYFVWTPTAIFSTASFLLWIIFVYTIKYATNSMVQVSNSVRPPEQQITVRLNGIKVFIGLTVHAFLMPIAVLVIMFSKSIVWAGVRYYKENGKIVKVERKDSNGEVFTELFASSISRTLNMPGIKELIGGKPAQQKSEL
ncbi:Ceramide glucosyltransferase [Tritrichomonas foetus]|uniref:ceramide glucosyltransferase n=1 Tax=Tritrichomonas foetus TaxID=1144522 RepID=A0A1J4K348_9EUKA|nr:Ceramide glucosyltransferase [Tritrichomonas foetus]|eukprot:OHT05619.1 Ceramide glucosyltransferase [Tritrichomonas foetus]